MANAILNFHFDYLNTSLRLAARHLWPHVQVKSILLIFPCVAKAIITTAKKLYKRGKYFTIGQPHHPPTPSGNHKTHQVHFVIMTSRAADRNIHLMLVRESVDGRFDVVGATRTRNLKLEMASRHLATMMFSTKQHKYELSQYISFSESPAQII